MRIRCRNLKNKETFLKLNNPIDWEGDSLSLFQKNVKKFLSVYWKDHMVFEEVALPQSRLRLDFFNLTLRLAVECDGSQHNKFIPKFHRSLKDLDKQVNRDLLKSKWCRLNGIKLIRIDETDLPLTFEKAIEIGLPLKGRDE